MIETQLLTRSGDYVTTISVPPFPISPEVIAWGDRIFIRNPAGEYREGLIWFFVENAIAP